MTQTEKLITLGVFALFLFLLSKIGDETIKFYYMRQSPLSIKWMWWLALLFFVVGLGGMNSAARIDGTTSGGTPFTALIPQGAKEGTVGIVGGVSFSLAFISVFIIGALITHERGVFSSLFAIGVMMVLVIPLYLVLVRLINSRNKICWGICIAWMITLFVLARS